MRASEEGRFTNYSEELQFCVYENIYSRPLPFLTGSQDNFNKSGPCGMCDYIQGGT